MKDGEVVESASNLAEIFKGKFEEVLVPPPASDSKTTKVDAAPSPPTKINVVSAPLPADRGHEVTKLFPVAVDEDYRVFRRPDKMYYVYDVDSMDKSINEAGLKKAEVGGFIRKHLGG